MSSFLHRVSVFSFDTNLSRKEIREYARRYLPEFTVTEMLKVGTEAVLAYEKSADNGWFEDLQDSVEDIVKYYYNLDDAGVDREKKLVADRTRAISDFCEVIKPGLLGALDQANFDYRRQDYEVQDAEVLGVGMAVSIAVER